MGRKLNIQSTLGGILLLCLLSFTLWGCSEKESGKTPDDNPTETAPLTKDEAVVEAPSKTPEPEGSPLLICRGNKIRVRKEPNQKAEVLTMMDRNEVFISLGEESEKRERITINKFPFDSPWIKVQVPGKENLEGWVYGAFDRDNGLIEWLVRKNSIVQQEGEGRDLHGINKEAQAAIAGLFSLPDLTYRKAKLYSGYYYTRQVGGKEEIDGPFFITSSTEDDRDSRILVEGTFSEGIHQRVILSKYDPPFSFNLELKFEMGECTGREYRKFKGSKRIIKYSDNECSLDDSTVSYDL